MFLGSSHTSSPLVFGSLGLERLFWGNSLIIVSSHGKIFVGGKILWFDLLLQIPGKSYSANYKRN